MKADPHTIGEIFTNRVRYCVPIFQRHYVWEQARQWEPLWEDITSKAVSRLEAHEKRHPHYMGALVLESKGRYSTKKVQVCNVIDGQQRLTTLQVFLAALRDVASLREFEAISEEVGQYLFNSNPALMEDPDTEVYKVWPTRFDRDVFGNIMSLKSRDAVRIKHLEYFPQGKHRLKKIGYIPRLLEAYVYFYDQIVTFIDEEDEDQSELASEDRLDALYRAFLEDFKIVEIQLEEGDDAQVIFETLNDRGTPLLASDLIRNFIFYRVEDQEEDPVSLYDEFWSPYEQPFWSEEEKQGRLKRARLEFFMVHFLAAKSGHEVNLTKLFQEYKAYIQGQTPYASIVDELQDIHRYSPIYKTLVSPSEEDFFATFAKKLKYWDVTTIYPAVFLIMASEEIDDAEKAGALNDILSYIVRRAICQKTPKNYNKLFLQLVRFLRKNGATRQNFQNFMLDQKGETGIWPSNDEFKAAWLSTPVYSTFQRSNRIQYILREIEQHQRSQKSEDVEIKSWLTVEHVMPQNWLEHWSLQSGETVTSTMHVEAILNRYSEGNTIYASINRRDEIVDTIGNLTLLTQSLNSSVSNGPFDDKRKAIIEQSALSLNRYFYHVDEWDEDLIVERGERLFERAKDIWPYPARQPHDE